MAFSGATNPYTRLTDCNRLAIPRRLTTEVAATEALAKGKFRRPFPGERVVAQLVLWLWIHLQLLLEQSGRAADLITVNPTKKYLSKKSWNARIQSKLLGRVRLLWLSLGFLVCGFPTLAQHPPNPAGPESGLPAALGTGASPVAQQANPQLSGRISGRVVDATGMAAAGATVRLTRDDQSLDRQMQADDDGQFSFANVAPGSFRLTVRSEGFATQAFDGHLRSGSPILFRRSC